MRPATLAFGVVLVIPLLTFLLVQEWGSTGPEMSAEAAPTDPRAQQPDDAFECFAAAKDDTMLDDQRAFDLCQGSQSRWPVRCFTESQDRTALSDDFGISLCQCAVSLRPVACFRRADRETTLSDYELVRMCSARAINKVFLPYCTSSPPPFQPAP